MPKIKSISKTHDEYIALTHVSYKKMCSCGIREDLKKRDLLSDLKSEISLIAWEGMSLFPQKDKDNKFLNFASRRLYRFLKDAGYRRPRNSPGYVRETLACEIFEDRRWILE